MAWIYFRELEESAKLLSRGLEQSPIVKTSDMPKLSYYPGWNEEKSIQPQFGMTLLPSKEKFCHQSTSSAEDFPARISALQELAQVWKESEADYFSRSQGLWGIFDLALCIWKTCRRSLLAEGSKSSVRLPRWGMTVDGECFQLSRWERRTIGIDGGAWPTPSVCGNYNRKGASKTSGDGLATAVKMWPTPTSRDFKSGKGKTQKERGRTAGPSLSEVINTWPTPTANRRSGLQTHGKNAILGQLNPLWVEWLMGYQCGATALEPWATAWFRSVRGKRSKD